MCTLSWRTLAGETGYELWFNRDELVTREAELPPCVWPGERAAGSFLAPIDGSRGGTWLAVSEHGLCVALLNDYGVVWRPSPPSHSRGDIVVAAVKAVGIQGIAAVLAAAELEKTAAFTLVALESSGGRACWHWDGAQLGVKRGEDVPEFFSSSSYRTDEVIAARRHEFDRIRRSEADSDSRRAFHLSHDSARGAESVLMFRPDANTRSVSHVRVGETGVAFEYVPVARGVAGPVPGEACHHFLPRADRRISRGES